MGGGRYGRRWAMVMYVICCSLQILYSRRSISELPAQNRRPAFRSVGWGVACDEMWEIWEFGEIWSDKIIPDRAGTLVEDCEPRRVVQQPSDGEPLLFAERQLLVPCSQANTAAAVVAAAAVAAAAPAPAAAAAAAAPPPSQAAAAAND